MFKNDPSPNDRLLTHVLSSATGAIDVASPAAVEAYPRVPIDVPASLVELLSGPALDTLIEFEPYTRSLFVKYFPENLNKTEKQVSWKEIEERNLKLPLLCFLRLLLAKFLIPDYIEIETMQEIVKQTVPSRNHKEEQFYQSGKFILPSEEQNYLKTTYTPVADEPQISYHEFQLILGRTGLYQPIGEKKGTASDQIREFFVEKLGFGKAKEGRSVSPSPRKDEGAQDEDIIESDEYGSESDDDDPYKKMELLQQRRDEAMKRYQIEINYEEIEKELSDLPPVPPPPENKATEPPVMATIKVEQLGKVKERKKKKEDKRDEKKDGKKLTKPNFLDDYQYIGMNNPAPGAYNPEVLEYVFK